MDYENMPDCDRLAARINDYDRYVHMECTCGECEHLEAATAYLENLAAQHHSLDDQRNFDMLAEMHGYALPAPVWRHVYDEIMSWRQAEAEQAEARAGWDPNP